jgi:cell division protein FtsI/penicillin-binding protein 2
MPVAGKTGTAQFEDKDKTHAWFVGFAPYDQPKISIIVMVEGGGGSFEVAVPIAKNILGWYSEHDQEVLVAN